MNMGARVALWVAIGVAVVGATLVSVGPSAERARPELQRVLDTLVARTGAAPPGVTAYVSGPHGRWRGAAGVSDVATREAMAPSARMRLESVSKAWVATLVLQLVGDGRLRLDDSIARWFPQFDRRITVRELLNHTSGLIDNNDIGEAPQAYIARVRDAALRARLEQLLRRARVQPGIDFPPQIWIDVAAALPLRSAPGSAYHYSNIGYNLAAEIAQRVARMPIATLVRERIAGPLGLRSVAYNPRNRIAGGHAHGYDVGGPRPVDATSRHGGVGAEGGIVANAEDEGRFLLALMHGRLLRSSELEALKTPPAGAASTYALGFDVVPLACAGIAYTHGGAGAGFKTSVVVAGDGSRVAVLLANGNARGAPAYYNAVDLAARELFCAA